VRVKRIAAIVTLAASIAWCVLPAESAHQAVVRVDGLGFPVFPHATSYAVFGMGIAYVAVGDIEQIVGWYREHSGREWAAAPIQASGKERAAELSFDDATGTHRMRIIQPAGKNALIQENLELSSAASEKAQEGGRALRGPADPLGVTLYPRRLKGQSVALVDGGRGFVSYATSDGFQAVRTWFNARLPNRFAASYHVSAEAGSMQTFHGGDTTVTIARRLRDGMTIVGVETAK
jgi:hypothetical protein